MIAVKMLVVLAAALTVVSAMRSASAASRHRVLALGLLCAASMPVFVWWAPGWGLPSVETTVLAPSREAGRYFLMTWGVGAALLIGRLLLGAARLAWLISRSVDVGETSLAAVVREMSGELGVRRPVRVLVSDRDTMPVTWGTLRPRILLPAISEQWTLDCLRVVIGHELAHIRRCDWLVHVAAELAASVYWWHPLMWVVQRHLRAEGERACDDVVLNAGVADTEYALQLIAVARDLRRREMSSALPAMARASSLETRVTAALDANVNRLPLTAGNGIAVMLAFAGLSVAAAGFGQPRAHHPTGEPFVSDVQRNIMLRLGGLDERLSLIAHDVTFREDRMEGRVELHARLGVDGWPTAISVVPPAHPDLASAAEVIFRQWHREPARLHGVPVEVPMRMTVDFRRAR